MTAPPAEHPTSHETPDRPDRPARSWLGPFRHRPYAAYWIGGAISNMGTWAHNITASILVYQLTDSILSVGILNFVSFLPILLFSLAGGVLSDRFDRRWVVVGTHAAAAIVTVTLAALTAAGQLTELLLLVTSFAISTLNALGKPSMAAILPSLVPEDEVADAVGMNSLQFILGQILGPLMASAILVPFGPVLTFVINAATFIGPIVAMGYLFGVGLGGNTGQDRSDGSAAVGATSYVRSQPWIVALLIGIVACGTPSEIVRTLSPAIAVERLLLPETTAGVIVAIQSIGAALGLILFVPLRRRGWSRTMVVAGFSLQAAGLAVTALATSLAVALPAVFAVGLGLSFCFPVLTGALQVFVPDWVRGRVMALHQMANLGSRPFAALGVGIVSAAVGVPIALVAGCLLAPLGISVAGYAFRSLDARRPTD